MKQKNRVYENGLTFLKLRIPSLLTDGEPGYFYSNHNYNKIVKFDWLSTALISALIGQFNRTVRVMPK